MKYFQDFTPEERGLAYKAVWQHVERHKQHPFAEPDSYITITSRIQDGTLKAALIAGYFVVFDVGPTWCTTGNLLYELLLLRVTTDGGFDAYVDGLVEIAKAHDCSSIMTGNGVLRPGLRRQYERRGFSLINESYYRRV